MASSSATRRSHQRASSRPPATAKPEMAAITGFDSRSLVGPIGPSPSGSVRLLSGPPIAFRSAPAQKVPPVPNSTATCAPGSASKARKASARAVAVGPSTALRRSGRSRMTVVTGPSCATRTAMDASSSTTVEGTRAPGGDRTAGSGVRAALADLPGVPAGQQGGEVAVALALARGLDLAGHQVVIGGPGDLPEDADGGVREVRRVQPRQREGVGRVGHVLVVHK